MMVGRTVRQTDFEGARATRTGQVSRYAHWSGLALRALVGPPNNFEVLPRTSKWSFFQCGRGRGPTGGDHGDAPVRPHPPHVRASLLRT